MATYYDWLQDVKCFYTGKIHPKAQRLADLAVKKSITKNRQQSLENSKSILDRILELDE